MNIHRNLAQELVNKIVPPDEFVCMSEKDRNIFIDAAHKDLSKLRSTGRLERALQLPIASFATEASNTKELRACLSAKSRSPAQRSQTIAWAKQLAREQEAKERSRDVARCFANMPCYFGRR